MTESIVAVVLILASVPIVVLLSLLFEGLDRKLHAKLQNRIGPPLIQPFYDIIKLFGKERIIPENAASPIFTTVPVIAAVCAVLGATIPLLSTLFRVNFFGDLILVLYLLAMPSLMIMLGGAASGNPFGILGFSRAVIMLISYEVLLIMAIGFVSLKTGFSLTCLSILIAQENAFTPLAFSHLSIALAAAVFLFCIPAAVGIVPFDLSEAKTEIAHGVLIEYSGAYLALMKVAKSTIVFTLTFLSATLFFYLPAYFKGFLVNTPLLNFGASLLVSLLVMFCTVTLPRTIFARAKIKQAVKFYWAIVTTLVVLATVSLVIGI